MGTIKKNSLDTLTASAAHLLSIGKEFFDRGIVNLTSDLIISFEEHRDNYLEDIVIGN